MDEQDKAKLREAGVVFKKITALKGKQSGFEHVVSKWNQYFNAYNPLMPQMNDAQLQVHAAKFQEAADEFSMFLEAARELARLGFPEFLTRAQAEVADKLSARVIAEDILAGRIRTRRECIAIQNGVMIDITKGQLESNARQRAVYEKANQDYTNTQRYPARYCSRCQGYLEAGRSYSCCPLCGSFL